MFSYLLYLQQMLYSTTSKCVFQKIFLRFQQRSIVIEDYISTKFPSILSKRYFESKIKSLKLRKTEAYKSIGRYLKRLNLNILYSRRHHWLRITTAVYIHGPRKELHLFKALSRNSVTVEDSPAYLIRYSLLLWWREFGKRLAMIEKNWIFHMLF